MSEAQTISVQELAKRSEQHEVDVVDVRTPAEFREIHAAIARNVPLDSIDPKSVMAARNGKGDQPLYVICQSGGRSKMACEKFVKAGYAHVVDVAGGTRAWEKAGLDVVRGKKAVSLERQVRICAGFLILVGSALGYFVHPAFIGLAAFVGAGLMYAGITDTCAMGMMMAKMPWNQVKQAGQETQACASS